MTHTPTSSDANKSSTTRRSLLTSIAAGTVLVAGCSGDDNNSEGGPRDGLTSGDLPDFTVDEDVQPRPMMLAAKPLVNPDSIEFLDEFAIELAVANVGGATITNRNIGVGLEYTYESNNTLSESVNEPNTQKVTLPEIDSGEWAIVKAEVRVNAAGTWKLKTDAAKHPEFDFDIEAGSKHLAPGESAVSEAGGFKITALEPRFERALHYNTEEGGIGLFTQDATGVLAADSDEILLVHRFAVESTIENHSIGFGTVLVDNQFGTAGVDAHPGSVITSEDMRDDLETLVVPDTDEPFGNNVIESGQTLKLATVQRVDEEDLADASLSFLLWGEGDDIVFETNSGAPSLPSFELVDATIEEVSEGFPVIKMTVKNTGDNAGTFRGGAQFFDTRPTASDWVYLPDGVEVTLDSGEQETLEITASRGDGRFRVLPFKTEVEI